MRTVSEVSIATPPEIIQNLSAAGGKDISVSFTPVLAPMPRGILATCTAATTATEEQAREIYDKAYNDEPFIHVLPAGVFPQTGAVIGSNAVQIGVTVDADAGQLVVISQSTISPRAPPVARCNR